MFVDLSQPIRSGMPVYPGDPAVELVQALAVADDGVAVMGVRCGTHAGTHLDAPSHVIDGGRTVDEIPLSLLHGEAQVLQARVGGGSRIDLEHVRDLPARLPAIVCIATGWDEHFDAPDVMGHPFVGEAFARELWARGARVLGTDAMSPDDSSGTTLPVHEFWLGNDGVIIENLVGLTGLPDRVEVSLLPLRIRGADGSPVRAVAWV